VNNENLEVGLTVISQSYFEFSNRIHKDARVLEPDGGLHVAIFKNTAGRVEEIRPGDAGLEGACVIAFAKANHHRAKGIGRYFINWYEPAPAKLLIPVSALTDPEKFLLEKPANPAV
jgi:hypothetical protein